MADMSLKGWQAPKSRHIRAMGVPTRAVGLNPTQSSFTLAKNVHHVTYFDATTLHIIVLQIAKTGVSVAYTNLLQ